jgi:hypothetical protein
MHRFYRNLNRACWAWQNPRTGTVEGYADACFITAPRFAVSEAGRQRCIRRQRRSVHAYIYGELAPLPAERPAGARRLSYNPFRGAFFYWTDSGTPVGACRAVYFDTDGTAWGIE